MRTIVVAVHRRFGRDAIFLGTGARGGGRPGRTGSRLGRSEWNQTANGKLPTMATKLDPAVWIRDGSFSLRAIDTVEEALLVIDQFRGERGCMFFHARSMLEGARDGRLPLSEARQTFWFFAEDNKLLAEPAAA